MESWSRGVGCDGRTAVRARAVLMCAEGRPVVDVIDATGLTEPTVRKWRDRYATEGLAGLMDRPRSGRPVTVDRAKQQEAINPPSSNRASPIHTRHDQGTRMPVGARLRTCRPR